jgi:exosortase A
MSARAPWLAIALGLVVLGVVFAQEAGAAFSVWGSSTAYGHCFLVLPIVLWLLWERRAVFETLPPVPALWPALLALPLMAMWLLAYWLGIMEGRQLAAMGFVELLLLAGLGWRLWWAASAGFLYLVFLVPFGAFLTPMLQNFTATFIANGLTALRIPFEANAYQISIPEGSFYVAEACAGLRFLIAAVAFGVLYAVTMFRSPWRRAAFIAISCVVPVVANGLRGLGIVVLGHILGSAQAGAADHLIYGWVFFSVVILLLAAAGFPFREVPAPPPDAVPAVAWPKAALGGCAIVAVLACVPPVASSMVFARSDAGAVAADFPRVKPPASCTSAGAQRQGVVSTEDFSCNGQDVRVTFAVLPRRTNPAQILEAARKAASSGLVGEVDSQVEMVGGVPWVRLAARDLGGAGAYAVWIDGVQRVGGLHDRLVMARDMFSAGAAPVAVSLRVAPGNGGADGFLAAFMGQVQILRKKG